MSRKRRGEITHRQPAPKPQDRGQEANLLELLVPYMGCLPPFSRAAANRCTERGLLPGSLLTALEVLHFLSYTVLSAQNAQRAYGVRASVLLSMGLDESSFDICSLVDDSRLAMESDDERLSISPAIEGWFMKRAKLLATSKKYRSALRMVHCVKVYVHKIAELGFFDHFKAEDILSNVEIFGLEHCDLGGMLPVGQFRSLKFEKICDPVGNILSLRPSVKIAAFLEDLSFRGSAA